MKFSKDRKARMRERLSQGLALSALLIMGGMAIAGPSGVFAWSDAALELEEHEARIAQLEKERADLKLRVDALDPDNADPDMVGEMLRRNLNVVNPDDVLLPLPEEE